jgi:hypothetical protein
MNQIPYSTVTRDSEISKAFSKLELPTAYPKDPTFQSVFPSYPLLARASLYPSFRIPDFDIQEAASNQLSPSSPLLARALLHPSFRIPDFRKSFLSSRSMKRAAPTLSLALRLQGQRRFPPGGQRLHCLCPMAQKAEI